MGKAKPPIDGNDFDASGFDEHDVYDAEEVRRYHEYRIAWARAKAVFDELINGIPDPDFDNPEKTRALHKLHMDRLDALIKSNLDASSIWEFVYLTGDMRDSALAKLRVAKRLENDPRQAEKALVRECWELWQDDPTRYKGKADFARDMLSKFEHLKSSRVIERWCLQWESEPSK